ncbi:MAG: DUF2924 domain-containing protein [Planctomycetes bacterium]|nr:DUF2924 domain-containing protein [Planctomycetota bacterium]
MDPALREEIEGLAHTPLPELKAKYIAAFGEQTRSNNAAFLRKRIAWRLQANATGGLSERARLRAMELANDADLRIRPPSATCSSRKRNTGSRLKEPRPTRRDPRLPEPGELLVREFKGTTVVVRVLERGFEYGGRVYPSLSPVAREATGSNWNGFLFFGLVRPARRQAARPS